MSLPTRERELKQSIAAPWVSMAKSLPTRERELKLITTTHTNINVCVAPYTGA